MEIGKEEGSKRRNEKISYEEMEDDDDDDEDEMEEVNKRKRALTYSSCSKQSGGRSTQACCQVDDCSADMCGAKSYHRRHKVCEFHAKAPNVLIAGLQQRFCQQCSRFHGLSEFDDSKRSCRRHLLGHNQRRRKTA